MEQDPKAPLTNPDDPKGAGPRAGRKSARVICARQNEFWTTPKQFWAWVEDGIVTYLGDQPLTGKFEGRRDKLLVMVNHVLLDESVPEHKTHVLDAYGLKKPRRPQYPKPPVLKRPR